MKVSLLLPVASAVLTAAFIVIPDEQTARQLAFSDHRQAPIGSVNQPDSVEPVQPIEPVQPEESHDEPHWGHHDDKEHKKNKKNKKKSGKGHGLYSLHPQFVLRKSHRKQGHVDDFRYEIANFEGFSPNAWDASFDAGYVEPGRFHEIYHTPGSEGEHHHHHHHEDEHAEEGPGDWPPKPPSWPPKRPGDEPTEPPHHPPEPPHWRPKPPVHPKPPGHPKHPPPHHWRPHKPNETIWQLITKSNHTSKFAKIVSEFDDLVAILNGTISNYTLFVPTNKAIEKFKKYPHKFKPSKEAIKRALTYHLTTEPFPAFKLLLSHTIPSALDAPELGGPQRLRVGLGPHGLAVNFYSRIVFANVFATNGVIHAVDSIIFPPPPVNTIISLFPTVFSTFDLAVKLTNLTSEIPSVHTGATLFAPPNSAFERLGPRINAFLFSPWGRKYLKALLQYHIVLNETLYSDAYYHPGSKSDDVKPTDFPKGHYHVDLPTLLTGKHLSIDISRFGGLINIVINGQSSVKVEDGIARDGVIQVVNTVLLPPKKPPTNGFETAEEKQEFEETEMIENTHGMTLKQFIERFDGLIEGKSHMIWDGEEFITGIFPEDCDN